MLDLLLPQWPWFAVVVAFALGIWATAHVVLDVGGARLFRLNGSSSPDYCAPGEAWAGRMRCNKLGNLAWEPSG